MFFFFSFWTEFKKFVDFFLTASQEGFEGFFQTTPEDPEEEGRRVWRQSQKEGSNH